jgi:hypothetical protein
LLTPIAKAWSTDRGVEAADINVQIHGGMGFMHGIPALLSCISMPASSRSMRERTGFQAIDLVGRKSGPEQWSGHVGHASGDQRQPLQKRGSPITRISWQPCENLEAGTEALEEATGWRHDPAWTDPDALAGASPYLRLAGDVIGGHYLTVLAMEQQDESLSSAALAHSSVLL